MPTLLIVFGGLALIFGFLTSAYCTLYKLRLRGTFSKAAAFLVNGILISAATFVLAITLIWPPVM